FDMLRRRYRVDGQEKRVVSCGRRAVLIPRAPAGIVHERPEEAAAGAHVGTHPRLKAVVGVRIKQPCRAGRSEHVQCLAAGPALLVEIDVWRPLLRDEGTLQRQDVADVQQLRLGSGRVGVGWVLPDTNAWIAGLDCPGPN